MANVFTVKNLCKDFKVKNAQDGVLHALKDINLEIEEKDIYGIIGLSGAGKSTLVRCLNLLEQPNHGEIYFKSEPLYIDEDTLKEQGKDVKAETNHMKKTLNAKRQRMGMIFQGFNLFDQKNVYRNICYPIEISKQNKAALIENDEICKDLMAKLQNANENEKKELTAKLKKESKLAIRRKVDSLLKIVGLEEKIKSYPSQLSGGQQQRVAIARALVNSPDVLLCDEPTSALDPNTTDQILGLLKQINQELGVTIIIITHEMRIVDAICNKVSIIDKSKIVEQGPVEEIFKNPKSAIAKQLILPNADLVFKQVGDKFLRIVHDGTVYEPIISNLIIQCKCEINILSSSVKSYDGKTYGQMVIQIPDDEEVANNIISFLRERNVTCEEVVKDDFDNAKY